MKCYTLAEFSDDLYGTITHCNDCDRFGDREIYIGLDTDYVIVLHQSTKCKSNYGRKITNQEMFEIISYHMLMNITPNRNRDNATKALSILHDRISRCKI